MVRECNGRTHPGWDWETPKGTPVLPLNVIKAREILAGKPPLSVFKGSKVLAFYDNILSPKTSQCVTIDIHAARAAYNNDSHKG